jgi:hypothetical protein
MLAHGAILLGEVAQHLASVEISCNFCPRRGKASVGRLVQEHGPDMPIPDLLRMLSHDCPRRLAARIAEPCGVHLPELSEIFVKKPGGVGGNPLRAARGRVAANARSQE